MAAGVIAAAAAVRQKYIRAFQRAGATAPQYARTLQDLGLKDSRAFRTLVRQGYLVAAQGGFYLNEERVALHRQRATTAILFIMAGLAVVLIALAFGTNR